MHKSGLKMKALLFIGILIAIIALIYLGKNLFTTLMDYHTSDVEYDNLIDNFVKQPEISKSIEEIKENNENNNEEETITNYPFVSIDWETLKKINPDIVAWIRIPGTVINYPVMQGKTNDDYIHTTFEKKTTSAGSIFLDYRNSYNFDDYVNVIYGHNMNNGSMFNLLKKYLKKDYLNAHKYIEIYTPEYAKVYEVSFVYTTYYWDGAYDFTINDKDAYKTYLEERNAQSYIKKEILDTDKKAIVLSTCHGKRGTENRCLVIITPSDDFESVYY